MLTGPEIQQHVNAGFIKISPFDPSRIGPNSYDVQIESLYEILPDSLGYIGANSPKVAQTPHNGYWIIRPGKFYLANTVETIDAGPFLPFIDGRSSIGRLGVMVHVTAGKGDIGYHGKWTLEIATVHNYPVRIPSNVAQAQILFHTLSPTNHLYSGRYQGGDTLLSRIFDTNEDPH